MNSLHLNLKKKWFDMISSGKKKEEYREIKKYWIDRLLTDTDFKLLEYVINDGEGDYLGYLEKKFDFIIFSNGYSKTRKQFVIELKSIKIKEGNQDWGAKPNIKYFVLELGKIVYKNF